MDSKWTGTMRSAAVTRRSGADFTDQLIEPFSQLRTEVDRLFERFPFHLPSMKLKRFASAPALEMTETDKAFKITAELPGMASGYVRRHVRTRPIDEVLPVRA